MARYSVGMETRSFGRASSSMKSACRRGSGPIRGGLDLGVVEHRRLRGRPGDQHRLDVSFVGGSAHRSNPTLIASAKSEWCRTCKRSKSNSGWAVPPELLRIKVSWRAIAALERVKLRLPAAGVTNDAHGQLESFVTLPSIFVWASFVKIDPNCLQAIADHDRFMPLSPACIVRLS